MKTGWFALTRAVGLAMLGIAMVAIALGRDARLSTGPMAPPERIPLGGGVCHLLAGGQKWLDLTTGEFAPCPWPREVCLEFAAISPRRGRSGGCQLVGRPAAASEDDPDPWLERRESSTGRRLDRVRLPVAPASRLAWEPSLLARLVFAGVDGHLYRVAFPDQPGVGSPGVDRLAWRVEAIRQDSVFLSEPCWLGERGRPPRLIVRMGPRGRDAHGRRGPDRLWWLRLDPQGRSVIAASPLIDASVMPEAELTNPAIVSRPDGRSNLAFLAIRGEGHHAQLWLAPLEFDPRTGDPIVLPRRCSQVADSCVLWAPVFSPDGRWVHALQGPLDGLRVVRLPVDLQ